MRTRARRAPSSVSSPVSSFALLGALMAALVLLVGWAVPARAVGIDPELVVESVTEDGYYVDAGASYLKSDTDLDRLRAALQQAGRAGVVVLPAGANSAPLLSRLLRSPGHKATYVVLTGTRLQAASSSLPKATVDRLVARARRAGDPKTQVLTFLDLLGRGHRSKSGGTGKSGNVSVSTAPESAPPGAASSAPAAAKKSDSGGNGLLYGVGAVVVVAAGAGGVLLWRRRAAKTS